MYTCDRFCAISSFLSASCGASLECENVHAHGECFMTHHFQAPPVDPLWDVTKFSTMMGSFRFDNFEADPVNISPALLAAKD